MSRTGRKTCGPLDVGSDADAGDVRRLLIIDDDAALRAGLQSLLERAGYRVVSARDGVRGLRLLREHGADLVVTDIFMPEGEGLETIGRIREEFPDVPIVAISGGARFSSDVDYLEVARALGAVAVVRKPFDFASLTRVIERVLDGSPPEPPAPSR